MPPRCCAPTPGGHAGAASQPWGVSVSGTARRRSVAVAVSGGRDSMALLHCLARAAQTQDVEVWALHVNHGLQPAADEWAAFVERTCKRWATRKLPVRCAAQRLQGQPARGQSVEAWARAGRYAALASMARAAGCDVVALAHHRADQAETFLLQALRGGGPAGLASMPASVLRDGITWLRPWLVQPREAIEAYVRAHRIRFIDDASNADPRFARNRLRLGVMPPLRVAFPEAEQALAEAARHAARARAFIDEVAQADVAMVCEIDALVVERWQRLSAVRQRECLRAWLAPHAEHGVPESLLDRLAQELAGTKPARWAFDGGELRRYRGRVTVSAPNAQASPVLPGAAAVHRAGVHPVPGCSASLRVSKAASGGIPLALLRKARWQAREAAQQFQRAPGTPPRSLKKQYQAAGVPAWSRDAPLLVSAEGQLLYVPGLGTDARALAAPGRPRVSLMWVPGR
jgi:tRNA(Ile)-lysidine synthase